MIIKSFQVVINTQFGAFHFDKEMADWLAENKRWKIVEKDVDEADWQSNMLVGYSGNYYIHPSQNRSEGLSIRTNPDIIECVRTLQEKHVDLPLSQRYGHKVLDLRIKDIDIHWSVEDVHDGKEKVVVWSTAE